MKLIALTASVRKVDTYTYYEQNADYFSAIRRVGALPVLLPLPRTQAEADAYMQTMGALLLTGGGDIDPAVYGEENTRSVGICAERDAGEAFLLASALKMKLPVLGICRGIQLANVCLGGKLHQDIEAEVENALVHPRSDRPRDGVHAVNITPGSLLGNTVEASALSVNSRHHQAVKVPGKGMVVCCRAQDGVIEGTEMDRAEHPFFLCVQWHPESMAENVPRMQRIFDAFIQAAEERNV